MGVTGPADTSALWLKRQLRSGRRSKDTWEGVDLNLELCVGVCCSG